MPQCDEAFAPRFYRYCAKCGAESDDGITIQRWAFEPLSDRLLIVINGMIFAVVLLTLYFWLLFRI